MSDVSHADLVNQMSALVTSWQVYLDQQRALDNGSADAVIAAPPGQPAPGWYPLTDPAGLIVWRACDARKAADASRLIYKRVQLGTTAGYTASSSVLTLSAIDNGAVIGLVGGAAATAVTVTLPNGAATPQGFSCSIIQEGTGAVTFSPATGAALRNAHSHNAIFGQDAMATVINRQRTSGGNNTWGLFGDTKAI